MSAHIHYNLSYLSDRRSRPNQALDHAQQALHLYQLTGHEDGRARALNMAGWCHALLGDNQQALVYCQRALSLYQRRLADHYRQATTWDSLGYAHHHLGQYAQAITCYQHALALLRDLGDRYNETDILTHLGDTHQAVGNPRAARDAWRQALIALDELDHPDADQVRAKLATC